MHRTILLFAVVFCLLAFGSTATAAELEEARIYIEYNHSGNDLGFHVFLDGEDWVQMQIRNPDGDVIFDVEGSGGYEDLGLTELFFEGAEPSLAEFDLEDLLALFPEGEYTFEGTTVDGEPIAGAAELSHDVPDAPVAWATTSNHNVKIRWQPVTGPADILPDGEIEIEGYQILVEDLDIILPEDAHKLTLPREFLDGLEPGVVEFEVLAIDASGNQTITEGSFLWNE